MPQYRRGREMVREGRLGTVCKVHMTWNRNTERAGKGPQGVDPKRLDWKAFLGNAPDQPFDDYRYRNWRWFWDFGGGIFTDLMVHQIDIAHWFLGLDHPISATSVGGFHQNEGVWQTPDTVQTLMTYPGGVQAHFEGTFSNAREGECIDLHGDRGEPLPRPRPARTDPRARQGEARGDGDRLGPEGEGFLRPARRRTAPPDRVGHAQTLRYLPDLVVVLALLLAVGLCAPNRDAFGVAGCLTDADGGNGVRHNGIRCEQPVFDRDVPGQLA